MRSPFIVVASITMIFFISSCGSTRDTTSMPNLDNTISVKPVAKVMTKEVQASLSPDAVLKDLMDGNMRYVAGHLTDRDLGAQIRSTTSGQYPKAVVLSCIDSRVPVEYLFDQGIGDIFVARVAGNVEDEKMLGSIEYGLGVAGSKLLMVLGHESCGAVKSAIDDVDVGSTNVDALLDHIKEHIHLPEIHRDSKDKDFFDRVVRNNVRYTVDNIRERSPIIKSLEEEGKIKIVGAYYSVKDGRVTLLDENLEGVE